MAPEAFATFVSILSGGDPDSFETIPRDRRAELELNDPQATYAVDLAGLDSGATSLNPPPAFSSAQMATEMAEEVPAIHGDHLNQRQASGFWIRLTSRQPLRSQRCSWPGCVSSTPQLERE